MRAGKFKIPDRLRRELDGTGLPWTVEHGTRHNIIRLDGRFAGICHGKSKDGRDRAEKNHCADIRRLAKAIKGEGNSDGANNV
jgi:hypothetical protein